LTFTSLSDFSTGNTRWFKYDRDKLWLVYTLTVPVIFLRWWRCQIHAQPPASKMEGQGIPFSLGDHLWQKPSYHLKELLV
jgi:hypothetical protein